MPSGLIAVGRCGAPQGIRGEVRVKSYTADPLAIAAYGPLTLSGGRQLRVDRCRLIRDDMLSVAFAGVADRSAAEALAGLELFVPRQALPAPDEEEFYHADLIGLAARLRDGTVLGTVTAVHNYGAGDILEITPERGESLLLPFTRAVAPEVDLAAGTVVIVPPDMTEGG